jgi:hypothetical protein
MTHEITKLLAADLEILLKRSLPLPLPESPLWWRRRRAP